MSLTVQKDSEDKDFWCITDEDGKIIGRYRDDIEIILCELARILGERGNYKFNPVGLTTWGQHDLNDGGFMVKWDAMSWGFGEATFFIKDGQIHCDSEYMSRKFLKALLCRMVDQLHLEHENTEIDNVKEIK